MKIQDLLQEVHYKCLSARPAAKGSETVTTFSRDIYYYNLDEVERQKELLDRATILAKNTDLRVTYQDHRKAIETASLMLGASTQHEIALMILSHRWFKNYRALAFRGNGTFLEDYSFILKRVGAIFIAESSKVIPINASSRLAQFTEPAVVQVNYITGTTKVINTPSTKFTLPQWATKYNAGAPESTVYHAVAGTYKAQMAA